MNAETILLVEDEWTVGSTISERLNQEGYPTRWVKSVAEALEAVRSSRFQLALLDIQLPDGLGYDVAAACRKSHPEMGIVFLTAMGSPEDRVRGLEAGAEDYIVKPFHFKELLLRIQNVLKRSSYVNSKSNLSRIKVGQAIVDFPSFQITRDGATSSLTHKECALLNLLCARVGQVVSRNDILDTVWSPDEFPTPRTVDNFIVRIRRWVEDDPAEPMVITSVRGIGYQLNEEFVQGDPK